jgi:hypothetical protein
MKPKVLVVCQGGNVRSSGLATLLKGTYGCDALNMGTGWAQPETQRVLCEWADWIVPIEPRQLCLHSSVNQPLWDASVMWEERYDHKRVIFDVGEDRWGNPMAEGYQDFLRGRIEPLLEYIKKCWRTVRHKVGP